MKNKFMQTAAGTLLGLLVIFGSAQIFVSGQENLQSEIGIQGVWQTIVTPQNCLTGASVAPSFVGLVTFNEGGTLAETAAGSSPALRSPGHGVWRRGLGERDYYMRFMFYRFDANGTLIGSQRVSQTVEFDPRTNKTYSAGTLEVIDLNGNVIGRGCSVSTATRFE